MAVGSGEAHDRAMEDDRGTMQPVTEPPPAEGTPAAEGAPAAEGEPTAGGARARDGGSGAEGPSGAPGYPPPPGAAGGPLRPGWWHRPLSRARQGRVLGGVVAGISDRYGWDRRAARVVTVLGAVILPVIVPLYLVAWVLLPLDPEPARAPADLFQGGARTLIAVGLVVVG